LVRNVKKVDWMLDKERDKRENKRDIWEKNHVWFQKTKGMEMMKSDNRPLFHIPRGLGKS
jgi:hypothetical protein